jgi:F-type H+-transporting ATPase subunit alpha
MELFKQPQYSPIPVQEQVAVIWSVQRGYMDDVPVDRVKAFQAGWTDFLRTRHPLVLDAIARHGALNDELSAELKAAADRFKAGWKA